MATVDTRTIVIRKATLADAPAISDLVNHYAQRGLMLPKSLVQVFESLREFVVAVEEEGTVLGCGALRLMWHDLAEIRSLAVDEQAQGLGGGRRLVEALIRDAGAIGLSRLFALTYQQGFFERLGFQTCSKEIFPQKVWADCQACPKRHHCDEIAMLLHLDARATAPPDRPWPDQGHVAPPAGAVVRADSISVTG